MHTLILVLLFAVGALAQGPGNFSSLLVTGNAVIDGTFTVGSTTTITSTLTNPLHVSSTSATQSGVLLMMGNVIKGSVLYSTTTGMTIKNGLGGVVLQQDTGSTSGVSLLSNHNVLDDGSGGMVVVGPLSALSISTNTLAVASIYVAIGGTNVPGLIGSVTSSALTSSFGGSIAGSAFVTVNSVTLPATGTYECRFSGTFAALSNIGCQISQGTSGNIQSDSNRESAFGPASWYTDAAVVVTSLISPNALVIGECNRAAGTHTIVPGNNRITCQRVAL